MLATGAAGQSARQPAGDGSTHQTATASRPKLKQKPPRPRRTSHPHPLPWNEETQTHCAWQQQKHNNAVWFDPFAKKDPSTGPPPLSPPHHINQRPQLWEPTVLAACSSWPALQAARGKVCALLPGDHQATHATCQRHAWQADTPSQLYTL